MTTIFYFTYHDRNNAFMKIISLTSFNNSLINTKHRAEAIRIGMSLISKQAVISEANEAIVEFKTIFLAWIDLSITQQSIALAIEGYTLHGYNTAWSDIRNIRWFWSRNDGCKIINKLTHNFVRNITSKENNRASMHECCSNRLWLSWF